MKRIFWMILLASASCPASAQNSPAPAKDALRGWHVKGHQEGYSGIELDAAYKFLADRNIKSVPVIVAVLDSGIDTLHEDLKPVLWVNPGEIPGNGKDDDGNGYVDDVHGWNFLGNPDGRNVNTTSSEWIRTYWRFKDQYEGKRIMTDTLSRQERHVYAQWQKARSGVIGKGLTEEQLNRLRFLITNLQESDSLLRLNIGKPIFTIKELTKLVAGSRKEDMAKSLLLNFMKDQGEDFTNEALLNDLAAYLKSEEQKARAEKVPPIDYRTTITGDDEGNLVPRFYGNNDIQTGTPEHGTHVSGIIAAVRNNGLGMDGIADNVRIMFVRTTPEGDEHDKDVANGIRYAVDNGAKIINMSFGKSISPDKAYIDEAVRYAISKDVLIVHGAGNSHRNIDGHDSYPCPQFLFTDSIAPNWITVGASTEVGKAASFSNFGKTSVDVFAPGTAIYATFPGGNKYQSIDGTSMASPVVCGIAAILRGHFPTLSAQEVRELLVASVVIPQNESKQPGSENRVPMSELCKSGGIVNALNAVQLAVSRRN